MKTPCPRSHSSQMVGLEVLLAPRHVCLILELHPLEDGAEVTIPPPRKWKLLGNKAGASSEQTFS